MLAAMEISAAPPIWVSTYGSRTQYPSQTHLTGFAQLSRSERNSAAAVKDKALADLAQKIRVRIESDLVLEEFDDGRQYNASVTSLTRSTTDLTLSGALFQTYEDQSNHYALAAIARESLLGQYSAAAAETHANIVSLMEDADNLTADNRSDDALLELFAASTLFTDLYDDWAIFQAVNTSTFHDRFFLSMDDADNIDDIKNLENLLNKTIDMLMSREQPTLNEALGTVALILSRQNVPGGAIDVPFFQYGNTDFSSEFGRYAASRLESELVNRLETPASETQTQPDSASRVIVQGRYWEENDKIRLSAIALTAEGSKLARAEVLFPRSENAGFSLKPQNFDEAMLALQEFADGALTDGGINVDVWTNKGRESDVLVFTEGEPLQIYLRVNQPAFLQLTYVLATGEIVLLEPKFYIGSDKVNRTVQLPYAFEVVPPFGIEQFIVTAYTQEPPAPQIAQKLIDGEPYDVFESVAAVVSKHRGLKRKNPETAQVGETRFSLTTLPK